MTIITDDEARRHSVTRDDPNVLNPGGTATPPILFFTFPQQRGRFHTGILPIELPMPWSRERDLVLTQTPLHESMWAAAVYKVATRIAALGFSTDDQEQNEFRSQIAQQRLLYANFGRGWVSLVTQVMSDYILTDNGGFIELIYRSNSLRSQLMGMAHLDSMRCTRTGDPDVPVIYEDLYGRFHELKAHQVITLVDQESPRAEARGTGMCAASRAYNTIRKAASIERYVNEKVSGEQIKAIHFINGIAPHQFDGALNTFRARQEAQGMLAYQGAMVIPATNMDAAISGYSIPLADMPDGTDAKAERDASYLIYAAALGVPLTFIAPLSHQGLGTGKQSEIMDDTADQFGVAAMLRQMTHHLNEMVMPTTTTFSWANANDKREQSQEADIMTKRVTAVTMLVEKGLVSPAQGVQLLADYGDVPVEFLSQDTTPNDMLTDDEKPIEATDPLPEPQTVAQIAPPAPAQAPAQQPATKTRRIIDPMDLYDDHALMEAAASLRDEIGTPISA